MPIHHPIHRISPEILGEIFLQCLPTRFTQPSSRDAPMIFTRVCHQWREVAISNPRLWTALTLIDRLSSEYGLNTSLASLWLSRAKGVPVSVRMLMEDPRQSSSLLHASILPNVSKIFSLNLDIPLSSFHILQELTPEVAPILSRFNLAIADGNSVSWPEGARVDLSSHANLKHLSVDGTSNFLKFSFFADRIITGAPWGKLVSLSITEAGLGVVEARNVLKECGRLETCELWVASTASRGAWVEELGGSVRGDGGNGGGDQWTLQNLVELIVVIANFDGRNSMYANDAIGVFFEQFRFPALNGLHIKSNLIEEFTSGKSLVDLHRRSGFTLERLVIHDIDFALLELFEFFHLVPSLENLELRFTLPETRVYSYPEILKRLNQPCQLGSLHCTSSHALLPNLTALHLIIESISEEPYLRNKTLSEELYIWQVIEFLRSRMAPHEDNGVASLTSAFIRWMGIPKGWGSLENPILNAVKNLRGSGLDLRFIIDFSPSIMEVGGFEDEGPPTTLLMNPSNVWNTMEWINVEQSHELLVANVEQDFAEWLDMVNMELEAPSA